MGGGGWGRSDRWLGIGVKWGKIWGGGMMVEGGVSNYGVEGSEGSELLENVSCLGVG